MRRTEKLMEDWMFYKNGEKRPVDLPHTWNALDGQDGGDDYFRGVCIYEKQVPKPEFRENERVYLQFCGVNASANVIWNGKSICTHHNGYAAFRIDVTEEMQDINTLRVEVDNGKNRTVYPQRADFTFYGGIYRDVEFLIVPKIHFDLDYYGGEGIRVTTKVKEKTGIVHAKAYINMEDLEAHGLTTEFELLDAQGNRAGGAVGNEVVIKVPHARLWNGRKDPYLYRLFARLKRGEEVVDEIRVNCGIRTFSIDPKKGFFLNGVSYPLRGVSKHQDFKGIGNAVSHEQMENDMELIREVGANTIRLAHYQHDQYFYDLCDRYGMVVWAEIPYISEHMPEARENTYFQMKELIVQNFNHPSIITWGLSNEITISTKNRADMLDNHRKLQALVKKMDPTRPTTLACFAMCHPFHPVTKISDLVAQSVFGMVCAGSVFK